MESRVKELIVFFVDGLNQLSGLVLAFVIWVSLAESVVASIWTRSSDTEYHPFLSPTRLKKHWKESWVAAS